MTTIVPGKQTVPRAKAYSVLEILRIWDGTYKLVVVIDATHTIQGLRGGQNRRKNLNGANADIWELIYEQLDAKDPGGRLASWKKRMTAERFPS